MSKAPLAAAARSAGEATRQLDHDSSRRKRRHGSSAPRGPNSVTAGAWPCLGSLSVSLVLRLAGLALLHQDAHLAANAQLIPEGLDLIDAGDGIGRRAVLVAEEHPGLARPKKRDRDKAGGKRLAGQAPLGEELSAIERPGPGCQDALCAAFGTLDIGRYRAHRKPGALQAQAGQDQLLVEQATTAVGVGQGRRLAGKGWQPPGVAQLGIELRRDLGDDVQQGPFVFAHFAVVDQLVAAATEKVTLA